jgi:hypothetical protein
LGVDYGGSGGGYDNGGELGAGVVERGVEEGFGAGYGGDDDFFVGLEVEADGRGRMKYSVDSFHSFVKRAGNGHVGDFEDFNS